MKDNFVEGEVLCGTIDKENFPTKAISTSGKLKYIVNTDNYKQIVSTSICRHLTKTRESTSCKYGGLEGNFPEVTQCRQLFWKQELLSISETAKVSGQIRYNKLIVQPGAILVGDVRLINDVQSQPNSSLNASNAGKANRKEK